MIQSGIFSDLGGTEQSERRNDTALYLRKKYKQCSEKGANKTKA